MLQTVNTLSSTDKLCSWKVPSSSTAASARSVKDMFPEKCHNIINRDIKQQDKEDFVTLLEEKGVACPMLWLLSPEPTTPTGLPSTIDDVLGNQKFIQSADPVQTFRDLVKFSPQSIKDLEKATRGQGRNPNWGIYRKGRITSSNFAMCLTNRKPSPSTMKTIVGQYDISGVKAVQYGLHHEKTAIDAYQQFTNLKVQECGVFLSLSGLLGASPDGIVDDNLLVEVKCPLSISQTTVEEAMATDSFYMKREASGAVTFNWKNPLAKRYYHQIQGQMYLANRSLCDFVIWTPKQCQVFRINKDPSWHPNLQKLEDFYMKYIYPLLTQ